MIVVADTLSIFHQTALSITANDLQRRFCLHWDLERDGNSEQSLLDTYLRTRGSAGRDPVLLTAEFISPVLMTGSSEHPYGVYFPDVSFVKLIRDGQLSDEILRTSNPSDEISECTDCGTTEFGFDNVVSSDTTMLDLIENHAEILDSRIIVVLTGNQLTGAIRRHELFSAAGRMALLALVLELEISATQLCYLFAEDAFGALPEGRRSKALQVFAMRYGVAAKRPEKPDVTAAASHVADKNLRTIEFIQCVDCTTFIDKCTMLRKCKLTLELSNNELRRVFSAAEEIRNHCAHPSTHGGSTSWSACRLRDLVREIQRVTGILSESYQREARGIGLLRN